MGDNAVLFFNQGIENGIYNAENIQHLYVLIFHVFIILELIYDSELCQWLWPLLLRAKLREFMTFRNGARMRKDKTKGGPSGISRIDAYTLPETWGGRDCLLPIEDLDVIREMKKELGGEELLAFSTPEFDAAARTAYDSLGIVELTFDNIWIVFTTLLPLVFP